MEKVDIVEQRRKCKHSGAELKEVDIVEVHGKSGHSGAAWKR